MPTSPNPDQVFELGIALGILTQLYENRMTQLLAPHDLTTTQFGMLSHLLRKGEPQSVSDIANAMEINQPGVTKVVRRLESTGLLKVAQSTEDKRLRIVSISAKGTKLVEATGKALATDIDQWFASWEAKEIGQLTGLTWRLVGWLDENRIA